MIFSTYHNLPVLKCGARWAKLEYRDASNNNNNNNNNNTATGIVTKSLRKNLEALPGKHSIHSLQKTAVLGTSHIIRKVLQCETGSVSGGGHRWFKRSTGKKACDKRLLLLLLLLLLLTAINFSPGGSSPYTSTDKTNKNKYTYTKKYKNTVQTIQNTVNTPTQLSKYPNIHTHTLQNQSKQPQYKIHTKRNSHNTIRYPQYKIASLKRRNGTYGMV
jgi:hypothetical protein